MICIRMLIHLDIVLTSSINRYCGNPCGNPHAEYDGELNECLRQYLGFKSGFGPIHWHFLSITEVTEELP